MHYNKKKKKDLKRKYELYTYNSDDISNDESLLDEEDNEKIFINNDSINDNDFKKNTNKKKEGEKTQITQKQKNAFNYMVEIDMNKRKEIKRNKLSQFIPKNQK